jgi:hypothetical protein
MSTLLNRLIGRALSARRASPDCDALRRVIVYLNAARRCGEDSPAFLLFVMAARQALESI